MKLKTIGLFAAACIYTGLIVGGMATMYGRALKHYRASPVAIVAASVCGKQEGAVVITGDGVIHSELDLDQDEAIAISKALPEGHGIEFAIPCQDPRT